ncbi:MAG: nitroreductase/quinone reductase family protein [Chloroflexi bacterium]|nr:nitroreductase/quinone reductase family protein [Chloroflexota bacterium]
MRRLVLGAGALVAVAAALLAYWRDHRRIGARQVDRLVNPFLVRRGLAGVGRSELGTLEHVGRKSGTVRLTPVHPVLAGDTVRIVVPLGRESEWARNVLAAGHCRLQLHDTVYELDEPVLLPAGDVAELPLASRRLGDLLGFMYLQLHRFGEAPGTLGLPPAAASADEHPTMPDAAGELVGA